MKCQYSRKLLILIKIEDKTMHQIRPGNLEKRNLVAGPTEVDPGKIINTFLFFHTNCLFSTERHWAV